MNGSPRVLLQMVLLTAIWGTNWVLVPVAVQEVSVWTFRAICVLGAGLVLLLAAKLRGECLRVPPGELGKLTFAAFIYLVLWNVGTAYAAILIPSGQAAVLGFTMPLWATLLSWLFLRERPSPRLFLAVGLAAAGIVCLVLSTVRAHGAAPLGYVLGLLAAMGWASGTIFLKRASLTVSSLVATAWQLLIAGLPILVIAYAFGSHASFFPSWTTIAVIGYITLVPMALGNAVWFSIVDVLPAHVAGLATVMVPMVAMVTGAIVRGEPFGAAQFVAMACCAASLLIMVRPPVRRLESKA